MEVSNGTNGNGMNTNPQGYGQPQGQIQRPTQNQDQTMNLSKQPQQQQYGQQTQQGVYNQQTQQNYNQQYNNGYIQQPQYGQQQNYGQQQYQNGYQQNGYQDNYGMHGQQQPQYNQYSLNQQMYPQKQPGATISLVGLIFSILSIICCGPILGIPALICSIIGKAKCRSNGKATAGIIISIISLALWIILLFTGIVSLGTLSNLIEDENVEIDSGENGTGIYDIESNNDYDSSFYEYEYDADADNSDDDFVVSSESQDYESTNDYSYIINGSNFEAKESVNLNNYDGIHIVVNGEEWTFGETKLSDIKQYISTGNYEEYENTEIEPDYYSFTFLRLGDYPTNYGTLTLQFTNNTDETKAFTDCVLLNVSYDAIHKYNSEVGGTIGQDGVITFDIGSNLTQNLTLEDAIDVIGEPDYEYTYEPEDGSEGFTEYRWYEYGDNTYSSLELDFNSQGLCGIDMDYSSNM